MTVDYRYKKSPGSQFELWPIISSLILAFYFAILYFPPLAASLPHTYVCFGCFVMWLILSIINDASYYLNMKPFVLVAFVFYAFSIIMPLICGYPVIANRYAGMPLVSFGYVIYDYYKSHGYLRYLRGVLISAFSLMAVTGVNTYIALINNPYIARSIKSSGDYSQTLASRGIGGYLLIYAVTAAAPILLYIFLKSEKKYIKALSITAYVFSILLVTKSNYLTAFLLIALSSAVLVCGYFLTKGRKVALYVSFMIIAVSLSVIFYQPLSEYFQAHIPDRIARVLFSLEGESLLSSIHREFEIDRLPTIVESLGAVVKTPLFGVLGARGIDMSGEHLTGFGQHSYIADTFALYGVLIGILPLNIVTHPFRENGKWVKRDIYFSIAVATSMFCLYTLNNMSDSIAIMYTMAFPLVRDSLNKPPRTEKKTRQRESSPFFEQPYMVEYPYDD